MNRGDGEKFVKREDGDGMDDIEEGRVKKIRDRVGDGEGGGGEEKRRRGGAA